MIDNTNVIEKFNAEYGSTLTNFGGTARLSEFEKKETEGVNMTQGQGYIVKRLLVDGHAGGGDVSHYIRVATPNPGETIYHGDFVKRQVEIADNGPMGSDYATVYIPVGEVTSEKYTGGAAVETF